MRLPIQNCQSNGSITNGDQIGPESGHESQFFDSDTHIGEHDGTATTTAGLSDSIPSHPLGIRPLGNQYIADGPAARTFVGTLQVLPDESLMILLEYLDQDSLRKLGYTCKFLYACCRSDDLWKALFLESHSTSPRPFQWLGTWRTSLLGLKEGEEARLSCDNVFSDVLHRPFVCSHVSLARFASNIPKANQIQRFENLSYEEFAERWTEKPFILTNCIQPWPLYREWDLQTFLRKYGEVEFRAEAVDWPFATYHEYMANTYDESPLYLFDRKFVEKIGIKVGRDSETGYWRPDCFGPDLFEVLGDERPAHRWLIIGPERSGSTFHKDPNGTSAWNAVIQGAKYWIMFPPDVSVPGVYVSKDSSEVTSPLSIAEWLLEFHAAARRLPHCIEGICRAGEIMHVPSGWWHLVVNLEGGIAITQNFVPRSPSLYHISEVLSFLQYKPDQVTGFRRDISDPYQLFVDRLGRKYPDLLDEALHILEKKKQQRKRKWDEAVGVDEDDQGRGFSFGFGGDDDIE